MVTNHAIAEAIKTWTIAGDLFSCIQSQRWLDTVLIDCQADLTCADKHSLSLGHLNHFLHHPLLFAFCLKASALPLFCLLFFPKENTSQPERESPPHVTFNLNINFSILTREPYLVQLL